jgi:hypothetical protein
MDQNIADKLDRISRIRYAVGRDEYGEDTWKKLDCIKMLVEEITDSLNYIVMQVNKTQGLPRQTILDLSEVRIWIAANIDLINWLSGQTVVSDQVNGLIRSEVTMRAESLNMQDDPILIVKNP